MKKTIHINKIIFSKIIFLLLMTGTVAQAQSTGDYKTKASGLWSDVIDMANMGRLKLDRRDCPSGCFTGVCSYFSRG